MDNEINYTRNIWWSGVGVQKRPSVEYHHMASIYQLWKSAQYLQKIIGSRTRLPHGPFWGPLGILGENCQGPKGFHLAFEKKNQTNLVPLELYHGLIILSMSLKKRDSCDSSGHLRNGTCILTYFYLPIWRKKGPEDMPSVGHNLHVPVITCDMSVNPVSYSLVKIFLSQLSKSPKNQFDLFFWRSQIHEKNES